MISLVPSITELVLDLGLGERLVGRTKFCIHPADVVNTIEIIGGTKNLRIEKIKSLKPDLILSNKEENEESQVNELASEFPCYVSDVRDVESAFSMISDIGKLLELETEDLTEKILNEREKFSSVKKEHGTAVYVIWNDPIMAAGSGTFIDKMLVESGFQNAVESMRYPELSEEELRVMNPDHLLLSSEPFPFNERHLERFRNKFPSSDVQLVDGEMFSWYGSKMAKAYGYFKQNF